MRDGVVGRLEGKIATMAGAVRGLGHAHGPAPAAAGMTVVVNDLGSGEHLAVVP